jgi:hypothetical protein
MSLAEAQKCLGSTVASWSRVFGDAASRSGTLGPGVYFGDGASYWAYRVYMFVISGNHTYVTDPTGGAADLQVSGVGGMAVTEGAGGASYVPNVGAPCGNCKYNGVAKLVN